MKEHKVLLIIIILVALSSIFYFYGGYMIGRTSNNSDIQTPATQNEVYTNSQYGFSFNLPDSWKGYSVIATSWKGDTIDTKGNVKQGAISGPMISIRHPLWTESSPRQDIPIMVFTISQWNDMQADKFHIGAAPMNPSELGRNSQYVFGLPARYNYSYLTGYEEVDHLIQAGNFQTK